MSANLIFFSQINNLIATANVGFSNSGVPIKLKLHCYVKFKFNLIFFGKNRAILVFCRSATIRK